MNKISNDLFKTLLEIEKLNEEQSDLFIREVKDKYNHLRKKNIRRLTFIFIGVCSFYLIKYSDLKSIKIGVMSFEEFDVLFGLFPIILSFLFMQSASGISISLKSSIILYELYKTRYLLDDKPHLLYLISDFRKYYFVESKFNKTPVSNVDKFNWRLLFKATVKFIYSLMMVLSIIIFILMLIIVPIAVVVVVYGMIDYAQDFYDSNVLKYSIFIITVASLVLGIFAFINNMKQYFSYVLKK